MARPGRPLSYHQEGPAKPGKPPDEIGINCELPGSAPARTYFPAYFVGGRAPERRHGHLALVGCMRGLGDALHRKSLLWSDYPEMSFRV